jgi:hypothetical protein
VINIFSSGLHCLDLCKLCETLSFAICYPGTISDSSSPRTPQFSHTAAMLVLGKSSIVLQEPAPGNVPFCRKVIDVLFSRSTRIFALSFLEDTCRFPRMCVAGLTGRWHDNAFTSHAVSLRSNPVSFCNSKGLTIAWDIDMFLPYYM